MRTPCFCCGIRVGYYHQVVPYYCEGCNEFFCRPCLARISHGGLNYNTPKAPYYCFCCKPADDDRLESFVAMCCLKRRDDIYYHYVETVEKELQDYKSLGTYEDFAAALSHVEACEFADSLEQTNNK